MSPWQVTHAPAAVWRMARASRGRRIVLVLLVLMGLLCGSAEYGPSFGVSPSLRGSSRLAGAMVVVQVEAEVPVDAEMPVAEGLPPIPCRFVDARGFRWMLAAIDETPSPRWRTGFPIGDETPRSAGAARGLILPHHDVAAPMIGRILSETAEALAREGMMPEPVIVLGPNHAREGANRIQTFHNDWETPEGIFPADRVWTEQLARTLTAAGDPRLMEREHSLAYLVPWLTHFFPDASLLPVLISGALNREGCRALSETLSACAAAKRCLVVASIDFSHDRQPEEALAFDETTWRLILASDAAGILDLDNRYLDAPPTLATFLMTMAQATTGSPVLAGHAEASLFLGKRMDRTTSYLAVAWPP